MSKLFALAVLALGLLSAFESVTAQRAAEGSAFRKASALALESLGAPPPDPTNRWADDARAAALGRKLFFDERLSGNGRVACATCHVPGREFQDGLPLGKGMGATTRRTMPIAGAAYSPFLFWDGRKDSLWAQALGPLESPVEHGGSREQYVRIVAEHYRGEYEHVFGPLPDTGKRESATRVFVNIGKSIEAYERTLRFGPARFDRFVSEWRKAGVMPTAILDEDEIAGLKLFLGKGGCAECHSGPLMTNNEFHNTGVPARAALPADRGRAVGRTAVKSDEFNCLSRWSDAPRWLCWSLYLLPDPSAETEQRFKVPTLRNVAERAPYMHAGQFSTLAQVLEHYNRAPAASAGHSELKPLHLTPTEIGQLEAFLRTLSGGVVSP